MGLDFNESDILKDILNFKIVNRKKLEEKYQNKNSIKKAIKKLEELGYVNDLDYSISYIKNKKYGKNRITYNLIQKGIEKKNKRIWI